VTTLSGRVRFRQKIARALRRNPLFLVSVCVFVLFALMAILANRLAPHGLKDLDLMRRLLPPTTKGSLYLGTDNMGRDVLTLVLFGLRTSLGIAGSAVLLAALFGGIVGMIAGYFGGRLDAVIMRLVDMQLSIPSFFFALAGTVLLGRGVFNLILVLSFVVWGGFARVARGSMLAAKEETYVWAARSLGASSLRIIFFDLAPNVLSPLLVVLSLNLPHAIMIEASLSFLGLGLSAEIPSLGRLISEGMPQLLLGAWWISILPGVVLMLLVLSFNTMADALRDILDVKQ
jgi:peptide/nickel transport system permease protein